jgi:hypothetical protein
MRQSDQYQALDDDRIVYIALRNSNYMDADSGDILPDAFRRRKVDTDGISITICREAPNIDEIKQITGLKSDVCGVDQVRVGDVRVLDLGLDIIQNGPTHGCITGIPYIDLSLPAAEIDPAIIDHATKVHEALVSSCKRVDRKR